MAVLERSELEASPLADLHAIADQLGLDGFRRLRKADLIDAILGSGAPGQDGAGELSAISDDPEQREPDRSEIGRGRRRVRRSPISRLRRTTAASKEEPSSTGEVDTDEATPAKRDESGAPPAEPAAPPPRTVGDASAGRGGASAGRGGASSGRGDASAGRGGASSGRGDASAERGSSAGATGGRIAEGVVELLGNGSAFLRVAPPEPSDEDVYISAAQVRRCELVSGDRVTGPVRTPRRSERYPSLVRIDTINGVPADTVSEGTRYEELPVAYPSERLALGSEDPTLEAIEWLAPLGRGSRAVIVGAAHAGKTETLRRLLDAVSGRGEIEVTLVLVGSRPEEMAQWQEGPVAPVAALSLAASADSQGQAVERAVDVAKRVAARGGHALVLIDSLDGLQPHAARKALAAARKLRDGGSLTVIATATRPFGGETTVIALDVALTSTGRQPILDLVNSGTLKPELLVGDDGAQAITQARATALEAAG
jgi:transcription termination factor Rho